MQLEIKPFKGALQGQAYERWKSLMIHDSFLYRKKSIQNLYLKFFLLNMSSVASCCMEGKLIGRKTILFKFYEHLSSGLQ